MKPPRYLGKLDRYDFLHELAVWAVDHGGKQFARDLEHLTVDIERHDEDQKQEIRDLLKARDDHDD
jgi:hypothetical protein